MIYETAKTLQLCTNLQTGVTGTCVVAVVLVWMNVIRWADHRLGVWSLFDIKNSMLTQTLCN